MAREVSSSVYAILLFALFIILFSKVQFTETISLSAYDSSLTLNSTYVPYTGATGTVDLNTQTLSFDGSLQDSVFNPYLDIDGDNNNIIMGMTQSAVSVGAGAWNNLAYGFGTVVGADVYSALVWGDLADVLSPQGIALGANSYIGTGCNDCITIGGTVQADSTDAFSLGSSSVVKGNRAFALGSFANAGGGTSGALNNVFSLGVNLRTLVNNSMTLGIGGTSNGFIYNNKSHSILFALGNGTQNFENSLEIERFKGVRIGATSGENMTMNGGDLYVSGDSEIDGFLIVGANTEDGLSAGDINASTVYYDTLTAKSPTFMCAQGSGWCEVTVPEYKQSLYLQHDDDWNIVSVTIDNTDYTPQEFNQQVCNQNADRRAVCDEIIAKVQRLQAKKAEEAAIASCLSQGEFYEYVSGQCEFNDKANCEKTGYSYWTGSECLINPVLECNLQDSYAYSYDNQTCLFNVEKDCSFKGWNYNIFTDTCTQPVPVQLTTEELIERCESDISTLWFNGTCVNLEQYYQ